MISPETSTDGVLRDIKDGPLYKSLHREPEKKRLPKMTILASADEASIHNACTFKITHLSWLVSELPAELRQQSKNIMLSGLWVGRGSPNMKVFWEYGFAKSFRNIVNGIAELEYDGQKYDFSVAVLGAVMDKPMNRKSLNHTSYNGHKGCTKCHHPGEPRPTFRRVRQDNRFQYLASGSKLVYGYNHYDLKNSEEWDQSVQLAEDSGERVNGIIGISPLREFLKLPDQVFIDPMHLLYSGVVKTLLTNVLKKKPNRKQLMIDLNRRLTNVFVPSDFRRKPRNLCYLNDWKATELKYFIMFYLPSIKGLITNDEFILLTMTSTLVTLMTKRFLTEGDIAAIDLIADRTVQLVQRIFGLDCMTSNIHDLLHMADQVRETGPQPQLSTSVFEDLIRFMKTLLHGTKSQVNQLVKGYIENRCHGQYMKYMITDSVFDYLHGKSARYIYTVIDGHKLHGKPRIEPPANNLITDELSQLHFLDEKNHVKKYFKLRFNTDFIHGFEYLRKQTSVNHFIEYIQEINGLPERRYGDVQYFAVNPDQNQTVAVVKKYSLVSDESLLHDIVSSANNSDIVLELYDRGLLDPFFHCVMPAYDYEVIPLSSIMARAIRVSYGTFNHFYAVSLINDVECS